MPPQQGTASDRPREDGYTGGGEVGPSDVRAPQRTPEPPGPGVARRVLGFRIPLWSALVAVGVVLAAFTVLLLARPRVDLGRAIDGAVGAEVALTICNETVDRRGINPRTAELDFQEGLEELGARDVKVTVTRMDCGPDAP